MAGTHVTKLELAADLAQVSVARRFVRANLPGLPDDTLADAQLIVSELVTNAIEHGAGGPVVVIVRRETSDVTVTVESIGPAPRVGPIDEWHVADVSEITGRGLGIVRKVAHDIVVDHTPEHLVVSARLHV